MSKIVEDQLQGQQWGVFSTDLLVKTSIYFMSQSYFILASSIQENALRTRW